MPTTHLVHHRDRSQYLEGGLLARAVEELASPTDALGHSSEDEREDAAGDGNQPGNDTVDFALGTTPTPTSPANLHPPPHQILELWRLYLENVDPLTKVVHGPTLEPVIRKSILDLSSIPKGLEALLFAMYTAAVVSMNDADCRTHFTESRKVLLSRYRSATNSALLRARLICSTSLIVLQAFLIHLLSSRVFYDSRTLWNLTGLALRIAEGMGLHRDGTFFNLPPFEAEVRRRVWWQLKLLDGDSAELSGSDKFGGFGKDSRSPRLPLNINDEELHRQLQSLPENSDRPTDMMFCSLRFELRSYWAKATARLRQASEDDLPYTGFSSASLKERDEIIDEFEKVLENEYIRYCDPSQPIHLMTTLVSRAAVGTARLIAHHPRNWGNRDQISEHERRYVWDLSMKGLKQFNMMHSNHELERFSWHSSFYFRWQALIHILDTLRINPSFKDASQAWNMIQEVFEHNPDFVTNSRKPLHIAIGRLCLKAYEAREAVLTSTDQPMAPPPWYIQRFRKQRDAGEVRSQTREAAMECSRSPLGGAFTTAQSASAHRQASSLSIRGLQEQAPELAKSPPQGEFLPFMDDDVDQGLNLFLDLDTSIGDKSDQTIDWVKWDALLGDFT